MTNGSAWASKSGVRRILSRPAGLPAEALEERTAKMARRGQRTARTVKPASADPFAARAARRISGFDALITPTLARPAVPIGTWAGKGWFPAALSVGNWLCTTPWNLAGLPAISVPAPSSGLPVGVQIVAPAGGENVILSVAAELEHLRPWPQLAPWRPPPHTGDRHQDPPAPTGQATRGIPVLHGPNSRAHRPEAMPERRLPACPVITRL